MVTDNGVTFTPKDIKGLLTIIAKGCCINYKKQYHRYREKKDKLINSILRFDYIDKVKAKNINQKNHEKTLKLLTIDCLKKNDKFEIILAFSEKNTYISLSTEVIEINLEDQRQ